jgi:hypothetical protein
MDKRREPRHLASGPVQLLPADPALTADIRAELMDVSESGFRARHDCPLFYNGLEVGFSHGDIAGRARVVWNLIQGREVESGFWILPH